MARSFSPKQPGEILVDTEGFHALHAANRLLKERGLALRWRGNIAVLGDQFYVRLVELPTASEKKIEE